MARRTGAARLLGAAGGMLFVAAAVMAAAPREAPEVAQGAGDSMRQSVPINTVDGVSLVGTYFRGSKGRDTPCAILIHRYGDDSSKGDWVNLAVELQKEGFAVLTFDLRGHGRSTSVDPSVFWTIPMNRQYARGTTSIGNLPKKNTIEFKDFNPRYLPMLVNDVLSARRFLEVKNDAGELNTNSVVVIGAQEGAALGLLYTAAEFNRVNKVGFVPLQSEGTPHNAGYDIAAGVWLSLPLMANQVRFNADAWIRRFPLIRERVPMCLIYGERDRKAKDDADAVLRALSAQGRETHKFDTRLELKGTDLTGSALLGQSALGVNRQIVEYVRRVIADRKAIPWTKVDTEINRIGLIDLRLFGM